MRGRESILHHAAAGGGSGSGSGGHSTVSIAGVTEDRLEAATALSKALPSFRSLQAAIDGLEGEATFHEWLHSTLPENAVPKLWAAEEGGGGNEELTAVGRTMNELLVIHAFRPDRVVAMVGRVVDAVFGAQFLHMVATEYDLGHAVERLIKANTPILMCSVPGYDASGRVDDLAAELNRSITSIAIGSAEGFSQADKAINAAAKSGKWVMLKNVHLAPQWLVQLEKKLHAQTPNPSFRLFLTLEIHPKVKKVVVVHF